MKLDRPIGVIADDITGALDAGVQFVRAGLETVLLLSPTANIAAPVRVVSTDSREVSQEEAALRAGEAATRLAGCQLFKKIDSTMRGHVAIEIRAVLALSGQAKAIICPAVPEQRRRVHDGHLWVGDVLLHESAFAHDPHWPMTTSDLGALLGTEVGHVPLAVVREGRDAIIRAVSAMPAQLVVADAREADDLLRIAEAALAGDFLPCGAFGLAQAFAAALTGGCVVEPAFPAKSSQPVLVVAGSIHPNSLAQVRFLAESREIAEVRVLPSDESALGAADQAAARALQAGRDVVLIPPSQPAGTADGRRALLATEAEAAWRAFAGAQLGAIILLGGETASAVCRRLGVQAVRLGGQVRAGIPWGRLVGGPADGLPVGTKAGGFGEADALLAMVDAFREAT